MLTDAGEPFSFHVSTFEFFKMANGWLSKPLSLCLSTFELSADVPGSGWESKEGLNALLNDTKNSYLKHVKLISE